MELLIIIVNQEEYCEKILSLLVELEVMGATILDSEGLRHYLAYEVPIFAGLKQMIGEKKSANKTILALIENKEFMKKFQKLLKEEDIDFARPDAGIIITVPVNSVIKSTDRQDN